VKFVPRIRLYGKRVTEEQIAQVILNLLENENRIKNFLDKSDLDFISNRG